MIKRYKEYIVEKIDHDYPILKIAEKQGKPYDQITRLDCSYSQLTSLEGIENLVNLQIFSCHNNQLTSLDGIENLVNLQILGCSNNRLNSLEFGDFSLDAFELGIDETDLRRFKKLNFLSCIGNQFSNKYIKYIREYCKRKNITSNI